MNRRKAVHFMSAGAVVLGLALCVPSVLLAQNDNSGTNTPPTNSQEPNSQNSMGEQGSMGMRHHHPPSAERQLRHLTKMLNLTQDQQQQMLPILQDQQQKMRSMHEDTSMSPQDRRQQMRQTMMDTHQKLEALMTDTQKQKFEQMMQQRRQRWSGQRGMGQGPGNPPPPPGAGTPPPDAGTPPPPPPQQ